MLCIHSYIWNFRQRSGSLLTQLLSFSCCGRDSSTSRFAETLTHLCSMDHERSLVLKIFQIHMFFGDKIKRNQQNLSCFSYDVTCFGSSLRALVLSQPAFLAETSSLYFVHLKFAFLSVLSLLRCVYCVPLGFRNCLILVFQLKQGKLLILGIWGV